MQSRQLINWELTQEKATPPPFFFGLSAIGLKLENHQTRMNNAISITYPPQAYYIEIRGRLAHISLSSFRIHKHVRMRIRTVVGRLRLASRLFVNV